MTTVLDELKTLLQTGTEEEVRGFLMQRFKELPLEMQENFAGEMLAEALTEERQEREAILSLKEEAVQIIEALEQQ